MTPFTNVSYATGQKIRLQSATDKGSNVSYVWTTKGTSYPLENPEVVYDHIGESTKKKKFIVVNRSGGGLPYKKGGVVAGNFETNP